MTAMVTKVCTLCRIERPLKLFDSDGATCRHCVRAIERVRRKHGPHKHMMNRVRSVELAHGPCPKCGSDVEMVRVQKFKNGTKHLRVECPCGKFKRYDPRSNGDLDAEYRAIVGSL